jgi:NAD+ diphosphatase
MIHEISPHIFDNKYLSVSCIGDDDYIFHFKDNSLLMKSDNEEFTIPRKKEIDNHIDTNEFYFLFTFNHIPCFLVIDLSENIENQFVFKEINFFRSFKQKEIAWISIVAFQLKNWYFNNKFCSTCGSKTRIHSEERAIVCPDCHSTVYPRISPAIIVSIVSNNKILLATNSNFPSGWYSLIAGYADIGESLEETVIREVKEEVGLVVSNIRYYKSQPWPYSGSMMIGFIADADDNQMIQVDGKEITHAAWFMKGNLPNHPPNISIAGEMIEKFENGEL